MRVTHHSNKLINWPQTSKKILIGMLTFAAGLYAAWVMQWTAADLAWSLWLVNLTLTYLLILSALLGWGYFAFKVISIGNFQTQYRRITGLCVSLFLLFCVGVPFTFAHVYLGMTSQMAALFPIQALSDLWMPSRTYWLDFLNLFPFNPTSTLTICKIALALVPVYGITLIPAIIVDRKQTFAPLTEAINAVKNNIHEKVAANIQQQKMIFDNDIPFSMPMIETIRPILLFMFFITLDSNETNKFWVYAAIYLAYFFPWSSFIMRAQRHADN